MSTTTHGEHTPWEVSMDKNDDAQEIERCEGMGNEDPDQASGFSEDPVNLVALNYPIIEGERANNLQTRTQAMLNLLNNLLGAGLLAMPRALASGGLLFGLILMVAIAVANKYTLLLVLWMSESTLESASYPMIGKHVYGQQGILAVLLAYLLYTGGVLIVYLIALTDIMGQLPLFDAWYRWARVVLAMVICAPGAAMKSLKHIAAVSAVCMAGVFTLVCVLISACLFDRDAADGESFVDKVRLLPVDISGALQAAALFALQFSVQAGGIEVLSRVDVDSHPQRGGDAEEEDGAEAGGEAVGLVPDGGGNEALLLAAEEVSCTAFMVAGALSGMIGTAGYLRFGDDVKGDLLLNFSDSLWGVHLTMARIAYGFVVTCSFAFIMVPCRVAVLDLLRMRRHLVRANAHPDAVHRLVTGGILCSCALVAWLVPDLADMLEFVGVWATMALAFILPCLFHMELCRRQEGRRYLSSDNIISLSLLCFGILVVVVRSLGFALVMFEEATEVPAEAIADS